MNIDYARVIKAAVSATALLLLTVAVAYFGCMYIMPQRVEVLTKSNGPVVVSLDWSSSEGLQDYPLMELCSVPVPDDEVLHYGEFPVYPKINMAELRIRSLGATETSLISVREVHGIFYRSHDIAANDQAALRSFGEDPYRWLFSARLNGAGFVMSSLRMEGEIWLKVLLIGVVLWIVAFMVALRQGWGNGRGKGLAVDCALVSALVSIFVFGIIPAQCYIVASQDYSFAIAELLVELMGLVSICFLVLAPLLFMITLSYGRGCVYLIWALTVFLYLETGILSTGDAEINGDITYYENPLRIVTDWTWLFACVCAGPIVCVLLKRHFKWLAVATIVMTICSVFDVRCDPRAKTPLPCLGRCTKTDVVRSIQYSPRRNVFVFVIDSVTSEAVEDVFRRRSDLSEKWSGFVSLQNGLGMMQNSALATTGMLSGECLGEAFTVDCCLRYSHCAFKAGSTLQKLLNAGVPMYLAANPDSLGGCFVRPTSLQLKERGLVRVPEKNDTIPKLFEIKGVLNASVWDYSLVRMLPFGMKVNMLNFMTLYRSRADEVRYLPMLKNRPVNDSLDFCFAYVHTFGAHAPSDRLSNGIRVPPRKGYEAFVDHCEYVFDLYTDYFETLKRRGLYDNSTIIVLADHGSHDPSNRRSGGGVMDGGLSANALPMMMVKPEWATGPLQFDTTTPTTQANMHKLFEALLDRPVSLDEMKSILRADHRKYVYADKKQVKTWTVGADGLIESVDVK